MRQDAAVWKKAHAGEWQQMQRCEDHREFHAHQGAGKVEVSVCCAVCLHDFRVANTLQQPLLH